MSWLLELRGITKSFPGVRALDNVDFQLRPGEVHALMGENGAGKSTLIKVMTGLFALDSGSMTLGGSPFQPKSPHHAAELGISTVYQEVNLVPNLSVAENVCLGRESRSWYGIRWRDMQARCRSALARLGLDIDPRMPLGSFSIAVQQMVAIARAVDVSAKVLVLDEPTSSLDRKETMHLFETVRKLRDDGIGIVFVTHFLDQVFEVADRTTVLRNGRLVGTFQTQGLTKLELVSHMIGRSAEGLVGDSSRERALSTGSPVLEAHGLGRKGSVQDISIDVRPGETLGLAGLLGSGRTETLRLLFGADKRTQGRLTTGGKEARAWSPRKAMAARLAFCPEDRKAEGVFPGLSVEENLTLVVQAKRGLWRKLGKRARQEIVDHFVEALQIKVPDIGRPVQTLSGGNQQKVILARWLATEPQVLLLDEPTRGIDVGAKFEVANIIDQMSSQGVAVVFVSSELDETVRSCARVYVLRDQRLVGELLAEDVNEQKIMAMIAGGSS